jgi:hypothetical protein
VVVLIIKVNNRAVPVNLRDNRTRMRLRSFLLTTAYRREGFYSSAICIAITSLTVDRSARFHAR